MELGGYSEVLCGIDTVAIGGVATTPLFPVHMLKLAKDGVRRLRQDREGISLFVSLRDGRWTYRLQCSLPRLIYGNNFRTVISTDLDHGVSAFLKAAEQHFPELSDHRLDQLPIRRLDIAFDLPVVATTTLIQALRDCYLSSRNQPGFIYEKDGKSSFYSKDTRGKRPPSYRSLIGYAKRLLSSGSKELRLETRFHAAYFRAKFKQGFTLADLQGRAQELQNAGWKYIDELFGLLAPHDDDSLKRISQSAPEKQRDFLDSFGFLSREVPLDRLKSLFFGDGKIDLRSLKKYGVGFGDANVPELKMFAEIRREWSLRFSCPYKKEVSRSVCETTDQSSNSFVEQLNGRYTECGRYQNQLDDRNSPVPSFDLPDRHRMPTELSRKLALRNALVATEPRDRLSEAMLFLKKRLTTMLARHYRRE